MYRWFSVSWEVAYYVIGDRRDRYHPPSFCIDPGIMTVSPLRTNEQTTRSCKVVGCNVRRSVGAG
jgi:hypothetical protein